MTPEASPSDASAAWLIGTWQLLRSEAPVEIRPGTRMRFGRDGQLEYTIPAPEGVLRVTLRWTLADGVLRTAHDDGSNPVEVRAMLGVGDVLVFDFQGPHAWFIRVT